jgi:uncharacterized protein YutE (UPF0331/DUF86 family)
LVNPNILVSRIHKIRECVGFLKKIAKIANEEAFLKDPFLSASAERYLQVAIQAVLDICNHIVADLGLEAPSEYRQVPDILAREKLLPVRLSKRMAAMIGLRNILVHEYLKLDRRLVYHVLKKDLGDFERFIKAVSKFL